MRRLLTLFLCLCFICCAGCVPTNNSTDDDSQAPNHSTQESSSHEVQQQNAHSSILCTLISNTSKLPRFTIIIANDRLAKYESHTVTFNGETLVHQIMHSTQVTPGEYVIDKEQSWTHQRDTNEITVKTVLGSFFKEDVLQACIDNSTQCAVIDTQTYGIPDITIDTITGVRVMENIRIKHQNGIITSIESTFGPQRLNVVFNQLVDVVQPK